MLLENFKNKISTKNFGKTSGTLVKSMQIADVYPMFTLCNEKSCNILNYSSLSCVKVTPSGFEPKSSEPESEILSIELWGRVTLMPQK